MNFKLIGRIIAYILLVEAALLLPGMLISLYKQEMLAFTGFVYTLGIIFGISLFLLLITRNAKMGRFYAREGLLTTGLTWIVMSAI